MSVHGDDFSFEHEVDPELRVMHELAALWDTPLSGPEAAGEIIESDELADLDDSDLDGLRDDYVIDVTGKTEEELLAEHKANSRVMVIKRKYIRPVFWQPWTPLDAGALCDVVDVDRLRFMRRGPAETSQAFKQIIPYVVLVHRNLETGQVKVLSYQRSSKSGEIRLLGKRSIGFGGHIEPCDVDVLMEEAYEAGISRELREELGVLPGEILYLRTVGVINDESDDAGRVHLGMVLTASTFEELDLTEIEDTIVDARYVTVDELKETASMYESWSRLLIDSLLEDMFVDKPSSTATTLEGDDDAT